MNKCFLKNIFGSFLLVICLSANALDIGDIGAFINVFKSSLSDHEQITQQEKLLNLIDFNKTGGVSERDRQSKSLEIWDKIKYSGDFVQMDSVRNIPNPSLTITTYVNFSSKIKSEDGYIELWGLENFTYDLATEGKIKSTATRYLIFCESKLLLKAAYLMFDTQMGVGIPFFNYSKAIPIVGEKTGQFKIFGKVCDARESVNESGFHVNVK